ncbi:MAG: uroporphyrinogen-III C-methyltransferase [Smithellaceae bacterium]|nr:uroporphyrinogen-III C-methyltransferase [Smithellaceae bacterium]
MKKGKVYIIGAGPGDPGLITLKGLKALREADVIVYDSLVNEEIIRFRDYDPLTSAGDTGQGEGPPGKKPAKLIYAGKHGGSHTLPQEEINSLLVAEAAKGQVVARLKGGDPFIFGRGGEEAEVLTRRGIPFEVIPGVTSAIAAPAYAGIPLTHRNFTSTVAFVTGQENPAKGKSNIDWPALACIGTVIFYMGVKNLAHIVSSLVAAGKDESTPAALIRRGTLPEQETLVGNLGDIVRKAREKGIRPPAIFVVGQVVTLRDELNWFENNPLFGKGVVITRPRAQAGGFASLLQAAGARVIHFPTIEIIPPASFADQDRAIDELDSFHWIIFTSANGVRFFFQRLKERGRDIRDLKGIKICAVGPATAALIEARGIKVDLVPKSYLSEGIAAAFQGMDMSGKKILLPRAELARDVVPAALSGLGAQVAPIVVYRTVSTAGKRAEIAGHIDEGKVDVITFTSPSTVKGFLEIWGEDKPLPKGIRIACLGSVTGAAARKAGFRVDIMQDVFTIEALVEGMAACFAGDRA